MGYLIVFDTNAYRQLTYKKSIGETEELLNKIKKLEQNIGYRAYSSPFVPIELAYHLCDKKDPAFNSCRTALVANYLHTNQFNGSFRMLADKESLIAAYLFDVKQSPHLDLIRVIFKMAVDIINDNTFDPSINFICPKLIEVVEETEKIFLETVKVTLKIIDPEFDGTNLFKDNKNKRRKALRDLQKLKYVHIIAQNLVKKAHLSLNREIDQDELNHMSREIFRIFKAPIILYHRLLYKLVMSGSLNLHSKGGKWGNWYWDIEHNFSIANSFIDYRIPIMVTDDKQIVKNLKNVYKKARVYVLKDYLDVIGHSN